MADTLKIDKKIPKKISGWRIAYHYVSGTGPLNSISKYDLKRLNSIQYSLCRIVQRTSRFSREHMSPHLRSLHWLPVKQRIKFKWCLIMFKVLKLGLPPYFSPYFVPYTCKIATRRSAPSKNMLNRDIIPFNRNTYKSKSHYDR